MPATLSLSTSTTVSRGEILYFRAKLHGGRWWKKTSYFFASDLGQIVNTGKGKGYIRIGDAAPGCYMLKAYAAQGTSDDRDERGIVCSPIISAITQATFRVI